MITKTINLYTFDELTDKAKETAREWWRQCEAQDFGSFGELYEPAETAARLLGITFKTHSVRLMGGKDRQDPCIWWQLFSQGLGASFEGSYCYARGSVRNVRREFPTDAELNRIACQLRDLQKTYRYGLSCKVVTSGRSVHKYAMDIEYDVELRGEDETTLRDLLRDFADWIFAGIREEYDYRMSDESVDDAILANEYTFTGEGKREG